ncbi:hypothetical protein PROFUN_09275 [Planoprotostelium fungivorum]|uniref:Uncharacterized protein n=1 Tax=Planoprotostelium fungivorum TaxID=1890364 RepID=A0A2P6NL21_9EUKA|nr:hypothetical protein PROFUN_09275 [Planoprotostelium fungivorum]
MQGEDSDFYTNTSVGSSVLVKQELSGSCFKGRFFTYSTRTTFLFLRSQLKGTESFTS